MPIARITVPAPELTRALRAAGYGDPVASDWAARLERRRAWEFDRLPQRFGLCLVSNVHVTFVRDGTSERYGDFVVEGRVEYRP